MDVMGCHYVTAVDTLAYEGLTDWRINQDVTIIPNACADTVLLLNVLDHTDRPQPLVDQALRLLKVGGKALVFVHLGQGDDKHIPVSEEQVRGWLVLFTIERQAVLPATLYDPPAFAAVAVKQ